jgi:hypothetical protein
VWRFRSPHHWCRGFVLRTSEPKPHQINNSLLSFDSEVRKRGCRKMMRSSESGHRLAETLDFNEEYFVCSGPHGRNESVANGAGADRRIAILGAASTPACRGPIFALAPGCCRQFLGGAKGYFDGTDQQIAAFGAVPDREADRSVGCDCGRQPAGRGRLSGAPVSLQLLT